MCTAIEASQADHDTHIRADLFPPRGPLRDTSSDSDELRLAPALDWLLLHVY
jgi:hypothetical protein